MFLTAFESVARNIPLCTMHVSPWVRIENPNQYLDESEKFQGFNEGRAANDQVICFRVWPTFAVPSSDPLTRRGGPLLRGQQLLTKLSCSAIFFTCSPERVSQARTVLSGDAEMILSPSVVQWSSNMAFLWPVRAKYLVSLDATCGYYDHEGST